MAMVVVSRLGEIVVVVTFTPWFFVPETTPLVPLVSEVLVPDPLTPEPLAPV